jgi:hypothetical protein
MFPILPEDDDYRGPQGDGDPLRGCAWALSMIGLLLLGVLVIAAFFYWIMTP